MIFGEDTELRAAVLGLLRGWATPTLTLRVEGDLPRAPAVDVRLLSDVRLLHRLLTTDQIDEAASPETSEMGEVYAAAFELRAREVERQHTRCSGQKTLNSEVIRCGLCAEHEDDHVSEDGAHRWNRPNTNATRGSSVLELERLRRSATTSTSTSTEIARAQAEIVELRRQLSNTESQLRVHRQEASRQQRALTDENAALRTRMAQGDSLPPGRRREWEDGMRRALLAILSLISARLPDVADTHPQLSGRHQRGGDDTTWHPFIRRLFNEARAGLRMGPDGRGQDAVQIARDGTARVRGGMTVAGRSAAVAAVIGEPWEDPAQIHLATGRDLDRLAEHFGLRRLPRIPGGSEPESDETFRARCVAHFDPPPTGLASVDSISLRLHVGPNSVTVAQAPAEQVAVERARGPSAVPASAIGAGTPEPEPEDDTEDIPF